MLDNINFSVKCNMKFLLNSMNDFFAKSENIKKIAENLEFSTAADFQSKVKVLVENYTSVKSAAKKPVVSAKTNEAKAIGNAIDNLMNHSDQSDEQAEFLSENIKLYSQVLGRTLSE